VANSRQATKRARQAQETRLQRNAQKTAMRTAIKKVRAAADQGQAEQANQELKTATVIIDRLAGKNIIHENRAARIKSRLIVLIKKIK
jgi:small subunit ribosomal protein S20